MDYRNVFAISASGMHAEKLRLDVTAMNLANVNSSKGVDGKLFQPLVVTTGEVRSAFSSHWARTSAFPQGVRSTVQESRAAPRLSYDPGHPDADAKGFVAMPGVNQLTEMANMASALRAYQANVVALNAAKTMALKALELGGGR
jgi:flagellar basal-body rod protein FlgC